jgi:hypothetical protein
MRGRPFVRDEAGGLRDKKGNRRIKRESAGFGANRATTVSEWIVHQVVSGAFVDRNGVDYSMTKWLGSA